ncbi:MAG: hypothetical protein ACRDHO_11960 [Actinomycetota bacterium]
MSGDLVTAEATLDYGEGAVYQTVFIFELRDGKITKETAYWAQAFEAPERRAVGRTHVSSCAAGVSRKRPAELGQSELAVGFEPTT